MQKLPQTPLTQVTVYGYCTQNPDAGGCADATKTTSADALALVHKKAKKALKKH